MATPRELIRRLNSQDNKKVLLTVEELRVRGWLSDGSLADLVLCHVHMQNADLLGADLHNVDFHQADLSRADLSQANLMGARLSRANLRRANFSQTNLTDVDFFSADFTGAHNLKPQQLARARRLWGAIMPDGETYDARYNLSGDLAFARWRRIDIDVPQAMADFFRIPLETYQRGQELGKHIVTLGASV